MWHLCLRRLQNNIMCNLTIIFVDINSFTCTYCTYVSISCVPVVWIHIARLLVLFSAVTFSTYRTVRKLGIGNIGTLTLKIIPMIVYATVNVSTYFHNIHKDDITDVEFGYRNAWARAILSIEKHVEQQDNE